MSGAARASVLALAILCGCGEKTPPARKAPPPPADPAARDAETLGRDLFQLIDRAADYRSSHRGRYPASVARMGLDSLTPTLARRFDFASGALSATVAFRRPAGHALVSCSAGADVLEGASMNSGSFPVTCTTSSGETETMAVAGAR